MKNNKMRKDFLWGGAISACQAEGAHDIDGKTMTIAEVHPRIKNNPKKSKTSVPKQVAISKEFVDKAKIDPSIENYPKRIGIDFYHKHKEDIELLSEMGINTFRFSIAWSRIFPHATEDEPNQKALAYYDSVVDTCLACGMEPIVTLSHYDLSLELVEKYGGWYGRELIALYEKFCTVLFKRYKGKVKYWIPFNEINMSPKAAAKTMGVLFEDTPEYEQKVFQAVHHQFVASALVTKMAHEIDSENKIIAMVAYFTTYAYSARPEDAMAMIIDDQRNNTFYLDVLIKGKYPWYTETRFKGIDFGIKSGDETLLAAHTADYIGFSYYLSTVASDKADELEYTSANVTSTLKNPWLESNDWGWQIDPIGLRYTLNHLYERYKKPLMILENGVGAYDELTVDKKIHDPYRISYFNDHIREVMNAVEDGVDVRGFVMWGIIDIISSGSSEMDKRYGFVYVDQDNEGKGSKKRYKKDSFYWYADVVATNGGSIE